MRRCALLVAQSSRRPPNVTDSDTGIPRGVRLRRPPLIAHMSADLKLVRVEIKHVQRVGVVTLPWSGRGAGRRVLRRMERSAVHLLRKRGKSLRAIGNLPHAKIALKLNARLPRVLGPARSHRVGNEGLAVSPKQAVDTALSLAWQP